ncbi:MAG: tetratricopeptide repeat protein [Leptospirales bacterium]
MENECIFLNKFMGLGRFKKYTRTGKKASKRPSGKADLKKKVDDFHFGDKVERTEKIISHFLGIFIKLCVLVILFVITGKTITNIYSYRLKTASIITIDKIVVNKEDLPESFLVNSENTATTDEKVMAEKAAIDALLADRLKEKLHLIFSKVDENPVETGKNQISLSTTTRRSKFINTVSNEEEFFMLASHQPMDLNVTVSQGGATFDVDTIIQAVTGLFDQATHVIGRLLRTKTEGYTLQIITGNYIRSLTPLSTKSTQTEQINSLLQQAAELILEKEYPATLARYYFKNYGDNNNYDKFFKLIHKLRRKRRQNQFENNTILLLQYAVLLDRQNPSSSQQKTSDPEEIEEYYNKAIRSDSSSALPYYYRGIWYITQDRLDDAITDFENALENDSDYHMAYQQLGDVYSKKGQWKKAGEYYKLCLDHVKDMNEIRFKLAFSFQQLHKFSEAQKIYQKIKQFTVDEKPFITALINSTYVQYKLESVRNPVGALNKAKSALEDIENRYAQSFTPIDYYYMGDIQSKFKNTEKAIINYKLAIARAKDLTDGYDFVKAKIEIATLLYHNKDYNKARQKFNEILNENKGYDLLQIHYYLGKTYLKLYKKSDGKQEKYFDDALKQFEIAGKDQGSLFYAKSNLKLGNLYDMKARFIDLEKGKWDTRNNYDIYIKKSILYLARAYGGGWHTFHLVSKLANNLGIIGLTDSSKKYKKIALQMNPDLASLLNFEWSNAASHNIPAMLQYSQVNQYLMDYSKNSESNFRNAIQKALHSVIQNNPPAINQTEGLSFGDDLQTFNQGIEEFKNKHYKKAKLKFHEYIDSLEIKRKTPENEVLFYLAASYFKLKDYNIALEIIEKINPDKVQFQYVNLLHGAIYLQLNKYSSAIDLLNESLIKNRNEEYASLLLFIAYYLNREDQKAFNSLQKTIHYNLSYTAYYLYIIENLIHLKSNQRIQFYLDKIEKNPGDFQRQAKSLAQAYLARSQNKTYTYFSTMDEFINSIDPTGEKIAYLLFDEAQFLIENKNMTGAEKKLNQAVKIKPDYALAWYYLGHLELYKYNTEKAMDNYKQAIEYDSNLSEAYYYLGLLYIAKDKYFPALEEFEKAISLKSVSASTKNKINFQMGYIYYKLGEYELALNKYSSIPEDAEKFLIENAKIAIEGIILLREKYREL